jgi:TolA-binding protein
MRIRHSILAVLCAGACAFAQQQPAPSSTNQAQQQTKSDQKKQSPREANPFPEAESQKAADAANAHDAKKAGESSSYVDLKRFDAPAGSAARISNGEGGYVHDPQLGAQDVRVGGFYLQVKNYKGAYDRFLEATRVAPENGQAVFGLAEAARGLDRKQEAETNYTIYLQAFPDGKKAKDAQKALKELDSAKK